MTGRVLAATIVLAALLMGAVVYYYQIYGYYERVSASSDGGTVDMMLTTDAGVVPAAVRDFEGIDSASSPIRFRACMVLEEIPEGLEIYDKATPRNAPAWFECFDAKAIGASLEAGEAATYLSQANIVYGIDRVLAVYPDGRAFAWHEINPCGTEVFKGRPAPEGCPPVPEGET